MHIPTYDNETNLKNYYLESREDVYTDADARACALRYMH